MKDASCSGNIRLNNYQASVRARRNKRSCNITDRLANLTRGGSRAVLLHELLKLRRVALDRKTARATRDDEKAGAFMSRLSGALQYRMKRSGGGNLNKLNTRERSRELPTTWFTWGVRIVSPRDAVCRLGLQPRLCIWLTVNGIGEPDRL